MFTFSFGLNTNLFLYSFLKKGFHSGSLSMRVGVFLKCLPGGSKVSMNSLPQVEADVIYVNHLRNSPSSPTGQNEEVIPKSDRRGWNDDRAEC